MPTYKNNTDSRIVDQGVSFDPYDNEAENNGQEKTSDKILVEEILTVDAAGVFVVGETVTGQTSAATGVVLRHDTEDNILDLIDVVDGPEVVPGEGLVPFTVGEDVQGAGAADEILVRKDRLTKVEDTPYFNPVVAVSISTANPGDDETVVINIDRTEAIIILWHNGELDVSLNVAANVVTKISTDNDEYMVETDGEVQSVILTQVGVPASDATILQFSSRAAAYQYFD